MHAPEVTASPFTADTKLKILMLIIPFFVMYVYLKINLQKNDNGDGLQKWQCEDIDSKG